MKPGIATAVSGWRKKMVIVNKPREETSAFHVDIHFTRHFCNYNN